MQRSQVVRFVALGAMIATLGLAACSKTADETKDSTPAPAAATEPAPPPAAASSTHFEFKIGELAAVALSDGGFEMPNDNKVLGVGKTPEEVAAVLTANGLPADRIALAVNPLLVRTGDKVLLFDTGAGSLFGPTTGKLPGSLADAGIDPASVTDIFISHSHGDHVGGLVNGEGKPAFPNATIHMSKPEWEFMSKDTNYAAMNEAIRNKVDAFKPGAELVPGVVTAVEIKGHTPGHSGYKITSGADSLLFVGDSMHHYVVSVQKPDWTIAFDGDNATATASRVALISDLAASGQRVYAVHFPFPGLGHMQKGANGATWVAE